MPPKRTRQDSVGPESVTKKIRTETDNNGPALSVNTALDPLALGHSSPTNSLSPVSSIDETSNVAEVAAEVAPEVISTNAPSNSAVVNGAAAAKGEVASVSATSEIEAIKIFNNLGVEPGALAGVALPTLNAILAAISAKDAIIPGSYVGPDAAHQLAATVKANTTLPVAPSHNSAPSNMTANQNIAANNIVPIQGSSTAVVATEHADDPIERGQAIQALVNIGVSASRIDTWSVAEMKRLRVILLWADPTRHTYSITKCPNKTSWGIPAAFNDTSNVLCAEGTLMPLTFWVTGEVAAQWWFDGEGYPASRPALSIQPMVEATADFCKTQLNELCMPTSSSKVADQFGPSQVKASRWMNTRATKGQPAKTNEFKCVYDARKTLRDKALLQQVNVGQLKVHDFVVMEARLGRYAVKEEGAPDIKGKRRAMDRWQAFYDLQAVYKIKDAADADDVVVAVADFEI